MVNYYLKVHAFNDHSISVMLIPTFCDVNSKGETKHIPNIPVSNSFSTLETDVTKPVDENLNISEKNKIEETKAFLEIKSILLDYSKSLEQYCLSTCTMSGKAPNPD